MALFLRSTLEVVPHQRREPFCISQSGPPRRGRFGRALPAGAKHAGRQLPPYARPLSPSPLQWCCTNGGTIQGIVIRRGVITCQCYQTFSTSQLITTTDNSGPKEVRSEGLLGGALLLQATILHVLDRITAKSWVWRREIREPR